MTVTNKDKKKEQIKAIVESLKSGSTIKEACDAANVNTVTFWRWRSSSKKLTAQVDAALDVRVRIVEDALYMNCIEGNVTAQIYYLQNRASDRWQDKRNVDNKHAGEVTLVISKDANVKDH